MSKIEKLRKSAASERLSGNSALADTLLAKIAAMENKVPIQKLDDEATVRRQVEKQWEAITPTDLVTVLCTEPGLSRAIRREMPMSAALPLLKSGRAYFVGRSKDLKYPPQQTPENTPPIFVSDTKKQLFI